MYSLYGRPRMDAVRSTRPDGLTVLGSWITTVAWPREEPKINYFLLFGKFVMG